MKEIKFKFYYKNKFLEILSLKQIAEKCEFHWADDVAVCQFTGLKDKNGKEIYEGDIYTLEDHIYDIYSKPREARDLQNFFEDKGLGEKEYGDDYDSIEVIGNIYENKDLLI